MNYQPRTEKEIADSRLFPKGDYRFEVITAADKTSSNGNDMIELRLRVTNDTGEHRTIRDYLTDKTPAKLRHAATACSALDAYEERRLSARDFDGKTGWLRLDVEPAKNGYPARNVVQDYLEAPLDPSMPSWVRAS